tara:strand:- start:256 stop:822 length:567 start_codon:yes stop_codon:yes gene_type:complete
MKKKCGKCKEIKSFKDFTKNKSNKDGFSHVCVLCSRIECKNYYNTDNGLKGKFKSIEARCENKNAENYKYYGGRGIKNEWLSYEDFKSDMYKSYLKHIELYGIKETTIDRINNNKNYCKTNCKWSTWKEQSRNKRRVILYKGLTTMETSKKLGGRMNLVNLRINRGWSIKKAFTTPYSQSHRKIHPLQ